MSHSIRPSNRRIISTQNRTESAVGVKAGRVRAELSGANTTGGAARMASFKVQGEKRR